MQVTLAEAQVLAAEYKRYWNTERQHSGNGYQTPAEFAASLASGSAAPPDANEAQTTTHSHKHRYIKGGQITSSTSP